MEASPAVQEPSDAAATVLLPLVFHTAGRDALPPAPTSVPGQGGPATETPPVTGTPTSEASPTASSPPPPSPTPLPDACHDPLADGGFEAGPDRGSGWEQESLDETQLIISAAARRGDYGARLGGRPGAEDVLLSDTAVPTFAADAYSATLHMWLRTSTDEDLGDGLHDRLLLAVVGDLPEAIEPIATLGDEDVVRGADGEPVWSSVAFDVSAAFTTREDFLSARLALVALLDPDTALTTFDVDDISLELCSRPPSATEPE